MLIKLNEINSMYGDVNLARPIPVEVGYDPEENRYFAFNQLLDIFSEGNSRREAMDGFESQFMRDVDKYAYEDPAWMSIDDRKSRENILIYFEDDEGVIEIDEENFFGNPKYWETQPIIEEYARKSYLIADTLQANMDATNCLSAGEWVSQDEAE